MVAPVACNMPKAPAPWLAGTSDFVRICWLGKQPPPEWASCWTLLSYGLLRRGRIARRHHVIGDLL